MSGPKTLVEAAEDVLRDIERVGISEASGLEQVPPDRIVDPEKCSCGGGCESVLECEFWYWVRKTDKMEREANRQVQIAGFRVDSLFWDAGQSIVVELDGKQFHQDKRKDWERDKALLRCVDCVIHIPYAAMHFYPHATMQVLASWYPRFKLRGIDLCCLTVPEFGAELEQHSDITAKREYVDSVESAYEIWWSCETFGMACSPKAWLHRTSWKTEPIRRYVKHDHERADLA
jgi:very-short-patch-repair endonuclease